MNLSKIDISGSLNLLINNKKYNKLIQSAGNGNGSSETIRQLSNKVPSIKNHESKIYEYLPPSKNLEPKIPDYLSYNKNLTPNNIS